MAQSKWRVAVIGAGPAGMYVADALSRSGDVLVDLYDRVFAPYGLLRYGVAPDHPSIKSVAKAFDAIRSREGVRFLGGVTFGDDIDLSSLRAQYHAVIMAVGSSSDRRLGIPGEGLWGAISSRTFVEWYNGHPDMVEFSPPLEAENAVVVGGGNVALDVARILLVPSAVLARTDIADHALERLASSKVRRVHLLMRRGPADVAFTLPEIRELSAMEGLRVVVDPQDLVLDSRAQARVDADRGLKRIYDVLTDCASRKAPFGDERVLQLHFYTSPSEAQGDGRVERVLCYRNRVVPGPNGDRVSRIEGSDFVVPTSVLISAIGYRGRPLPGLPFDEASATIPSVHGQVIVGDQVLHGVYVTGWARRGPSGVIGTNKADAYEVAAKVLEDFVGPPPPREATTLADTWPLTSAWWDGVDAAEQSRGERQGRPRVKFVTLQDAQARSDE